MASGIAKLVYVCHPYRDNPQANEQAVRGICHKIIGSGVIPVAPQIYLPQFVDEATQRKQAMEACFRLLRACDEVWVYGHDLTDGMREEVALALDTSIPVLFAGTARILAL